MAAAAAKGQSKSRGIVDSRRRRRRPLVGTEKSRLKQDKGPFYVQLGGRRPPVKARAKRGE